MHSSIYHTKLDSINILLCACSKETCDVEYHCVRGGRYMVDALRMKPIILVNKSIKLKVICHLSIIFSPQHSSLVAPIGHTQTKKREKERRTILISVCTKDGNTKPVIIVRVVSQHRDRSQHELWAQRQCSRAAIYSIWFIIVFYICCVSHHVRQKLICFLYIFWGIFIRNCDKKCPLA